MSPKASTGATAPERIVRLGEGGRLAGILTEGDSRAPLALFVSPAAAHHIGNHRLHVVLARELAAQGIPSLRFDIAGVGDDPSPVRPGPYWERARDETLEVMDGLVAEGACESFFLVGHCDGGGLAYWLAAQDPRVAAVAVIDGFLALNARYRATLAWGLAKRRLRALLRNPSRHASTEEAADLAARASLALPEPAAPWIARPALAPLVARVRARGVPTLWVISAEFEAFGTVGRWRRTLGTRALPAVEREVVIEGSGHLYPEHRHRMELARQVGTWAADHVARSRD